MKPFLHVTLLEYVFNMFLSPFGCTPPPADDFKDVTRRIKVFRVLFV